MLGANYVLMIFDGFSINISMDFLKQKSNALLKFKEKMYGEEVN